MFEFVDRWLDRLEGKTVKQLSEAENLQMIHMNLRAAMQKSEVQKEQVVLLTGNVSPEILANIHLKLSQDTESSVKFTYGENPNICPETVEKLEKCNGIVLVEQKKKSTIVQIEQLVERIRELDKTIYGFMLV